MSHVTVDLEGIWAAAERQIERRPFFVFPSGLNLDDHVSIALWPSLDEVGEFLSFAESLGVRVLYRAAEVFTSEKLDDLEAHALDALRGDGLPSDVAEVLDDARTDLDRLFFVGLWWVFEGVVHEWSARAEWEWELQRRLADAIARARAESRDFKEERALAFARRLADAPEFQRATGMEQREMIARSVVPELDGGDEGSADKWLFLRVVRLAVGIYQTEIRPRQERAIADHARPLLDQGMARSKVAERLGISDDRLKRILQTHPD